MDIKKAYEITNAKIQFVSLVDKAANLKSFLITKADDGKATFTTCGRIVKKDTANHFVTGIVYEPLEEDAHGNFMTEEEITKAAYYFAKNGSKVDLQHSFEPLDNASVVESWVAKSDFKIGDETVQKGTWLMTVEVDDDIFEKVEKGEITGFSMGGVGVYSEEDVKLDSVTKTATGLENEKKGIFKKLAEMFGFDVVEKGAFAEEYSKRQRSTNFWTAFNTLEEILYHYESWSGKETFENDETRVKEALTDFTTIVENILTGDMPVTKAIAIAENPVEKAGKKISGANRDKLQGVYDQIGELLEQFADPEPEGNEVGEEPKNNEPAEGENNGEKEDKDVTKAEVEKMLQETVADVVAEAVTKALGEQPAQESTNETVTQEIVQDMIAKAVADAIAPVLKARGVPTAMNDNGTGSEQPVEKHYLHGIL
jgi:hypothetical protein